MCTTDSSEEEGKEEEEGLLKQEDGVLCNSLPMYLPDRDTAAPIN